jgi:hypothetical protein
MYLILLQKTTGLLLPIFWLARLPQGCKRVRVALPVKWGDPLWVAGIGFPHNCRSLVPLKKKAHVTLDGGTADSGKY